MVKQAIYYFSHLECCLFMYAENIQLPVYGQNMVCKLGFVMSGVVQNFFAIKASEENLQISWKCYIARSLVW